VIVRPASSLAQDRESSPVKDQRSTTVLRRQLIVLGDWANRIQHTLITSHSHFSEIRLD